MVQTIKSLLKDYTSLKPEIKKHLSTFYNKTEKEQYNEFIFCILTPQSNAHSCWEAVQILLSSNKKNKEEIADILKGKTRFHNTKAERIIKAEQTWSEIKRLIDTEEDSLKLRNQISHTVDGYGLKEAGHFLRNIGKSNNKIAILDRHILRNLVSYGAINDIKIKGNKGYLKTEQETLKFAEKTGIPVDELDLLFWHKEHGEFFK